jgi:hypothetical protein
MSVRRLLTITIAASAALAGCHGKPAAGPAAPLAGSTGFQGFRIPGNMVDARASGFRCEPPVASGFTCAAASAGLYGMPASKATVWLSQPSQSASPTGALDNGAPIDADAQSRGPTDSGGAPHADETYREIVLVFDRPGCASGVADPSAACTGPAVQLEQRLDKDGWVYLEKDWGREYYKQGVPLQVTTEFPDQGAARVVIRSADLQDTGQSLVQAQKEAHQRAQDDRQLKVYAERLKATSQ